MKIYQGIALLAIILAVIAMCGIAAAVPLVPIAVALLGFAMFVSPN